MSLSESFKYALVVQKHCTGTQDILERARIFVPQSNSRLTRAAAGGGGSGAGGGGSTSGTHVGRAMSHISGVKRPLSHSNSLTSEKVPKYGVDSCNEHELGKVSLTVH